MESCVMMPITEVERIKPVKSTEHYKKIIKV